LILTRYFEDRGFNGAGEIDPDEKFGWIQIVFAGFVDNSDQAVG